MKKLNPEEISAKYNSVRDKNVGKKFTNEQVINLFKEAGISQAMAIKIAANPTLMTQFRRERMGRGKHIGYTFPYTPIHKSWFKNWIYPPTVAKEEQKSSSFEEECAEYLKKQGYQLRKCVGFDADTFKKDYPQLYQKYLIYESV